MDTEKLGLVDQALSWRNHGTQGAHHVCYIELNREVTACRAQGGRACDTHLDQGDRCSKLILWEQFLGGSSPCEGAVPVREQSRGSKLCGLFLQARLTSIHGP